MPGLSFERLLGAVDARSGLGIVGGFGCPLGGDGTTVSPGPVSGLDADLADPHREQLVAAEAVSTKHTARKLASTSAMMRMNVSFGAVVIGS